MYSLYDITEYGFILFGYIHINMKPFKCCRHCVLHFKGFCCTNCNCSECKLNLTCMVFLLLSTLDLQCIAKDTILLLGYNQHIKLTFMI